MSLYQTSSHDLFADAFFILNGRLMFASLHGRDSGIMSFLAGLSLPAHQGGIDKLGFRLPETHHVYPFDSTAHMFTNLSKRVSKYMTHNFGMLTHVFVYSDELVAPDPEKRMAWIIQENEKTDIQDTVWQCIKQISDIPLMDKWRSRLITMLERQDSIRYFQPALSVAFAIVGLQAVQIALPDDFDQQISQALKYGALTP